jgi:pyridoxal phosphate enzyme (YggS family)
MLEFKDIKENIIKFKERVAASADRSGRTLQDISIVPAVKTQPVELIAALKEMGIYKAGENRVQEFIEHYPVAPELEWHFIGQLQTNKVKYIADKVALIHSLDRLSLAEELNKAGGKLGRPIKALIEVNVACEDTKGGISINSVYNFFNSLQEYKNLEIAGLMSVPPQTDSEDMLRSYFLKIKELYDKINLTSGKLEILSLGMSHDFEIAIECGSNMVRPGRILFGERS